MANDAGAKTVIITRPNDTNGYGAGDVIGAATGSSAAIQFEMPTIFHGSHIMITSAELMIDANALISGEGAYTLHLYNVTPPSALGDNTAWDLPAGDRNAYLGAIDLGTPVDLGSTLYVETHIINKQTRLQTQSLWGYLVTVAGYTPTAQRAYRVTLNAISFG